MRYYLFLLASTLLMASGFVVSKMFLNNDVHPLSLVASRFTLAGLVAVVWLYIRGQLVVPKTIRDLLGVILVGTLQTAVLFGTGFFAMTHLSAATLSLMTLTMPIWVTVLQGVLDRQVPRRGQVAALVLGMVGVTLIVGSGVGSAGSGQLRWYGLAILGAISWASATMVTKRAALRVTGWSLNGWQMLIGGLEIQLLMAFLGVPLIELVGGEDFLLFFWLVIPASIVSFGLWFAALQLGGASVTSGYLFLIPLFTALMSVSLLDASFTLIQMLGGVAVAMAVWLMSRSAGSGPNSPGD
ncbi:MAG: DMT family transporter [Luminiphilus sp.]|nr:DMT family transporter [Luminiphilus sp.]